MIDRQQLSYTEWTEHLLREIEPDELQEWPGADPLTWIAESTAIRKTIYPEGDAIAGDYVYRNLPIVKQRLSQAGVRIAAYLNALFAARAGD
jgi:hypothetical protein